MRVMLLLRQSPMKNVADLEALVDVAEALRERPFL